MSDAEPLDASLLPPRQFFRFSADVLRADDIASPKGFSLDERYAVPALGEHSRAILAEVGYSAAEIEALAATGAI